MTDFSSFWPGIAVVKYWRTLFGGLNLCILHKLLASSSAAQATQNNKIANNMRKECKYAL